MVNGIFVVTNVDVIAATFQLGCVVFKRAATAYA